MALSALKPVVVQVKPILTFHPSGAAENVQNRFPTHVKNFACGLGENGRPAINKVHRDLWGTRSGDELPFEGQGRCARARPV